MEQTYRAVAQIDRYRSPEDIPEIIPILPLPQALLLPRGHIPLNIFEPRYIDMIDHVLAHDRIIGMVQPRLDADQADDHPTLHDIGCCGRLTTYNETKDGRYLITLTGICRFNILEEMESPKFFRQCRILVAPWQDDFHVGFGEDSVDRKALLAIFRSYLQANDLEADWESVTQTSNEVLVNSLSMMSPYGIAEKQALLEAPDLKTRADTLVAITEIALQRDDDAGVRLQ